ncbi:hypothetical protein AB0N28_03975 [Streptomyces sp. NPDC051130]|uniref:hypothetical protein n=1 Tax=Streptomyces sp. NPDC051130 TaxID=3157223 RepID=UPI003435CDC1
MAALSGGIDLFMWEVRGVLATELNLADLWCAVSPCSSGSGHRADHSPYVDNDAIFGSPYPVFDADRVWMSIDRAAPVNLAELSRTA